VISIVADKYLFGSDKNCQLFRNFGACIFESVFFEAGIDRCSNEKSKNISNLIYWHFVCKEMKRGLRMVISKYE